jgi:hypothetical protein
MLPISPHVPTELGRFPFLFSVSVFSIFIFDFSPISPVVISIQDKKHYTTMSLSQIKDELAEAREICRSNLVKQVMMDNQIATSFGLRLCLSTEMPLIAKRAGYSAVLMNLEHAPIGIETMRDISVACLNVG